MICSASECRNRPIGGFEILPESVATITPKRIWWCTSHEKMMRSQVVGNFGRVLTPRELISYAIQSLEEEID